MQKRGLSLLVTLCMLLSVFAVFSISVSADSTPSDWAVAEVNAAINEGLFTDKVTKDYQKAITREEFCELVVKLYEKLTSEKATIGKDPFSDTDNTEILKAYSLGIVKGVSETEFTPNNNITRQEICVMLTRCIDIAIDGSDITSFEVNHFADRSSIADWAIDSIDYSYTNGIIKGVGDNKVDPLGNTTCEQAILLAYRIFTNQANLRDNSNTAYLSANNTYFLIGKDNSVLFTLESYTNMNSIDLYGNNIKVGTMYDNGLNGDYIADDGIFSCTVNINSDEVGNEEYYAQSSDILSNKIRLYFFDYPSQEAAQETEDTVNNINEELSKIEENYANSEGFVSKTTLPTLMNKFDEYLKLKVQDNSVLLYEINEDNVYIKLPTGLSSVYTPKMNGTDNAGKTINLNITTYQPCKTDMEEEGSTYLHMIDDYAESISDTFDNCQYSSSGDYDDSEVTLDLIKSFGQNQVVLWHGHGYYGNIIKSCLVTGEQFDWGAWWFDINYFNDCLADRILNRGDNQVCISSKFIDYYCGDLSNSFFYLAACSSGKNSNLAQAFLNKGATAVVANSDTILRSYNVTMLCAVVAYMQEINDETNNYYTLEEALIAAKNEYGDSDASGDYGGVGATPMIFGGSTANDYQFAQASYGAYKYYGDAKLQDDGSIELTPLDTWRSGSVWYQTPFNTQEVEIRFSYWAGGGRGDSYNGADGIVCMFSDKTGIGSNGEHLGFIGQYGIEIDSYPENTNDPEQKHIALIQNDVSNHLKYFSTDKTDDSQWRNIRIAYKPYNLQVFLDEELILVDKTICLSENCYIGFSAATGAGKNRHVIKNLVVK